jgi:hypothetical protein
MGPKSKKQDNLEISTTEPIKAKRGRKSKKDLMAALNMDSFLKDKDNKKTDQNIIKLNVSEIKNDLVGNTTTDNPTYIKNNVYEVILSNNTNTNTNDDDDNNSEEDNKSNNFIIKNTLTEEPKIGKKRGRKPKGGKIIQQSVNNEIQKEEKPNIILHLKCSMKDLQTSIQTNNFIESYNLLGGKGDLKYDLIGNENIDSTNIYNDKGVTSITVLDSCYECDDYDDESGCKDSTKEIWKKLKQLEHNLHINNVNNKRSACFWDTCEFDNPPIYIPKHFINGTYHVYGCFCSPECGVAYLMNENIDSSTKFERYHLLNHVYAKIYDYKKNIKPAANPYYMLEKYYGNLSIQEYRSLLRNERLFLIVDKPLTRILPELHEDNDDFILNNKIIPSNNYNVKTRLQRKKQNKSSIINEKFGTSNAVLLE